MKNFYFFALAVIALMMQSCGASKQANVAYYQNPYPQQQYQQPEQSTAPKMRQTSELDRLVAETTDKLRAVGVSDDYDESDARIEALRNAQLELATLLENSIIALVQQYQKKSELNRKQLDESQVESYVESSVAQKISARPIGVPEIYDLADGSVRVRRCVELIEKTEEVVGEVYDNLTAAEVIGIDYDKEQFVKDSMEQLQQLRDKLNQ